MTSSYQAKQEAAIAEGNYLCAILKHLDIPFDRFMHRLFKDQPYEIILYLWMYRCYDSKLSIPKAQELISRASQLYLKSRTISK
ncbi:hypothetical protein [Aquimarina rhabdastrellae]